MAKSWKPKPLKSFPSFKIPKMADPFKMPKEPKQELLPHIITEYEKELITELCPAIKEKNLIKFWYEDKDKNFADWRIVEPHLIGQTNYKHENIWLVGWFIPTPQQIIMGHEQGWGNYILDEVKSVSILEQQYRATRLHYNRNDSRMELIYCATL
jgi:hypothetical protein